MRKVLKLCGRLISLFLFLSIYYYAAYSQIDSITTSSKNIDSVNIQTPIKELGSICSKDNILNKQTFVNADILSLFEVVERNMEFNFLTLGAVGNTPFVAEYGIIVRPSLYKNGSIHRQLPLCTSSFEFFPLLGFERIEILKGSKAEILGKNTNGLLINFSTRVLNTKYPYTQIWIGQAGYEYLGSSAILSQNIIPNINFFLLYQRYWSAGRFTNSNADRWNLLFGIRWNINPKFNILLQNQYTILNNGLYGGLNPDKSIVLFDNTFSVPNFEKLKNTLRQNDISINYIYLLSNDTTYVLNGGVLFSAALNEAELDEFLLKSSNSFDKSRSNLFVFDTKLKYRNQLFNLTLGTELEKDWFGKSLFSGKSKDFEQSFFALSQSKLTSKFFIDFGIRIDNFPDYRNYIFGANFQYSADSSSKVYLDFSFKDGEKNNFFRNGILAIFGTNFQKYKIKLNGEIFARFTRDFSTYTLQYDSIGNIIGAKQLRNENINFFGGNFLVKLPLLFGSNFFSEIHLNFASSNGNAKEWLPIFASTFGINYQFTRGSSYLDLGIELEILSKFKGMYILPFFQYPIEYDKRRGWQHNGINLYASAKLGNAFLNLSLRNILSSNYYYIPIYPEYDRSIRITVFWSFNN